MILLRKSDKIKMVLYKCILRRLVVVLLNPMSYPLPVVGRDEGKDVGEVHGLKVLVIDRPQCLPLALVDHHPHLAVNLAHL